MTQTVLVVGSINHDAIYFMDRLPARHETLHAREFIAAPGGKGANQAVACAQGSDCKAVLLGCVGRDGNGAVCVSYLQDQGVDTSRLVEAAHMPTGTACVMVEAGGENLIVVSAGANGEISPAFIEKSGDMFASCAAVLLQLEIPLAAVEACLIKARAFGKTSILNPAPFVKGVEAILPLVDILTPNQAEAQALTGISVTDVVSAKAAATCLLSLGVPEIVITLSSMGSLVASATGMTHVPAYPVSNVVDTTGAGDVYNGALAGAIADGASVLEAARFASIAASLSVQKPSASYCAPTKAEILIAQKGQR